MAKGDQDVRPRSAELGSNGMRQGRRPDHWRKRNETMRKKDGLTGQCTQTHYLQGSQNTRPEEQEGESKGRDLNGIGSIFINNNINT